MASCGLFSNFLFFFGFCWFFDKGSDKARKLMNCEFDVPYRLKPREKYDIFGIDLPEDSPILIHIHGGYWQVKEITHSNQAFLATQLHKNNIKVIAIGYELCPETSLTDIVKGLEPAMKKCLEYAKKCKSKGVILSGHSTGAHLVSSLFLNIIGSMTKEDKKLIKAVFLICGIYDLSPLVSTVINAGLGLDEETAKALSPQSNDLNIPEDTIFHIITAEDESPAFIEQAENFHGKLVKMGVASKYYDVEGTDHFDIIEKLVENKYVLLENIIEIMREITEKI